MTYAPILQKHPSDLHQIWQHMTGEDITDISHNWTKEQAAEAFCFISAIYSYSPYLQKVLRQNIDVFSHIICSDDLPTILNDIYAETHVIDTRLNLETHLRKTKQKVMLVISFADILGKWPLLTITKHIAALADFTLQSTLSFLLQQLHDKNHITLPNRNDPTCGSGILLLTMGKHGAYELNYSSDVDFMVFFDLKYIDTKRPDRLPIIYNRLVRDLVQIMETPTSDGYVFRCDLRLRPDPGAMPLAIQFETAIGYYQNLGQNWERAAMIKSRPVFAEPALYDDFINMITPWIWRRNMDFETILDIHSIKRQINTYHAVAENNNDLPYANYNVKLGHGGIREVEFFVQTQQLIHGGKHPQLRHAQTCATLHILASLHLITTGVADKMQAAYLFFRQLEHRIQMQEDLQTHHLPTTIDTMQIISAFMGYDDVPMFHAEISHHKKYVQEQYHQLFGEAKNLSPHGNLVFTGHEDDPETLQTLRQMGYADPDKATEMVRRWHHGRYRATRSLKSRQVLTEIVPDILFTFGQSTAPDTAILHFDKLLENLPSGMGIFALFLQHKEILPLLADILSLSPKMAQHIIKHPEMIENLIHIQHQSTLPERDFLKQDLQNQLKATKDFQDILETIRRWAKDFRFITGIHIIKNKTPTERCHQCLSDIADLSIQALLPAVEADFAQQYGAVENGQYTLLALGKCGSQQMTFTSDIDLIAVYDAPQDSQSQGCQKSLTATQYYMRLTQRLVTACHAQMAEGRLYEIDLRLRPSGEAGPLATSLDAFTHYYNNHAWTWEHMSLIRSRTLAGSTILAEKLDQEIKRICTIKRAPQKILSDITDMRIKMAASFPRTFPWQVKHRYGGMMDIMFLCQYLILVHAHQHPDIIQADIRKAISALQKYSILTPIQAQVLSDTYQLEKEIQSFLRACNVKDFNPDETTGITKQALCQSCDTIKAKDFDTLASILDEKAQKTWQIYQEIMAPPS